MSRRFLTLFTIGVLFSTLFSVSSASLNSPKVARAASCAITSGSLSPIQGFINSRTISVAFSTGDTISVTYPGFVVLTRNLVTGNMDVFLGPIVAFAVVTYTITVCPAGSGQATTTNFTDGRLNSHDPWETSAIYCMGDGSVRVYVIGSPWFISFTASPAEIAKISKHPSHNTLIKAGPGASLSRQFNGLLLVSSPGLNPKDGNYTFTFSDCGILIGL